MGDCISKRILETDDNTDTDNGSMIFYPKSDKQGWLRRNLDKITISKVRYVEVKSESLNNSECEEGWQSNS